MKLEYENGMLRVENDSGQRWQVRNPDKPAFSFPFDALSVTDTHAVRRCGPNVHTLSSSEKAEVGEFIRGLNPPSDHAQRKMIQDLRAVSYGLINSVITELEYDGLLDVMITGRNDSADMYADEARRVLSYADAVWNAYHGIAAQISKTPDAELRTLKEYAEMIPFPPALDHFTSALPEGFN
jgi:hypothetical protein